MPLAKLHPYVKENCLCCSFIEQSDMQDNIRENKWKNKTQQSSSLGTKK